MELLKENRAKFFHSSIQMARSKITPRKSMGGKAPRKALAAQAGVGIHKIMDDMDGAANAAKLHKARKQHLFRPGTKALRDIRKYQKTTDLLIRKYYDFF